ncbi:MAG: hypothetical protein QM674_06240 [Burkholderiaceae bacterium]
MPLSAKPPSSHFAASVSGDVTVEQTRLNTKGGSMTATLKKTLRAAFDQGTDMAVGARLDFGTLGSLVLLAPGGAEGAQQHLGHIRVTRMHDRRFMVDLVDDGAEINDPMTQAFLTMIVEQFKRGERALVDREAALAELDAIVALSDEEQGT